MLLTREAILSASDLKAEVVDVKEWGGSVRVATMTGAARDAWEQSLVKGGKATLENVRANLVSATVVDEKDKPLFTAADVAELGRKSAAALDRVCKVAQKLNRLTDSDLEDAKGN